MTRAVQNLVPRAQPMHGITPGMFEVQLNDLCTSPATLFSFYSTELKQKGCRLSAANTQKNSSALKSPEEATRAAYSSGC